MIPLSDREPMSENRCARVLLVDDNPGDIQLTRIAFEESGLPVQLVAVTTAAEARQRLAEPEFDLLLLDLNLTDASGHDVLAWAKAQPALRDLPVVIVSTSDYSKDQERAAELGAVGYIVKPNSFSRFVELLSELEPLLPRV